MTMRRDHITAIAFVLSTLLAVYLDCLQPRIGSAQERPGANAAELTAQQSSPAEDARGLWNAIPDYTDPRMLDQFLDAYPTSWLTAPALSMRFALVRADGSIEAYQDFVERYRTRLIARIAIAELLDLYREEQPHSVKAYVDFMNRYPDFPEAIVAREYLWATAFEHVLNSEEVDRLDMCDAFLDVFPDAPQASTVGAYAWRLLDEQERKYCEEIKKKYGDASEQFQTLRSKRSEKIGSEYTTCSLRVIDQLKNIFPIVPNFVQVRETIVGDAWKMYRNRRVIEQYYATTKGECLFTEQRRHEQDVQLHKQAIDVLNDIGRQLDDINQSLARNHEQIVDLLKREFERTQNVLTRGFALTEDRLKLIEGGINRLHTDISDLHNEVSNMHRDINCSLTDLKALATNTNKQLMALRLDLKEYNVQVIEAVKHAQNANSDQDGGWWIPQLPPGRGIVGSSANRLGINDSYTGLPGADSVAKYSGSRGVRLDPSEVMFLNPASMVIGADGHQPPLVGAITNSVRRFESSDAGKIFGKTPMPGASNYKRLLDLHAKYRDKMPGLYKAFWLPEVLGAADPAEIIEDELQDLYAQVVELLSDSMTSLTNVKLDVRLSYNTTTRTYFFCVSTDETELLQMDTFREKSEEAKFGEWNPVVNSLNSTTPAFGHWVVTSRISEARLKTIEENQRATGDRRTAEIYFSSERFVHFASLETLIHIVGTEYWSEGQATEAIVAKVRELALLEACDILSWVASITDNEVRDALSDVLLEDLIRSLPRLENGNIVMPQHDLVHQLANSRTIRFRVAQVPYDYNWEWNPAFQRLDKNIRDKMMSLQGQTLLTSPHQGFAIVYEHRRWHNNMDIEELPTLPLRIEQVQSKMDAKLRSLSEKQGDPVSKWCLQLLNGNGSMGPPAQDMGNWNNMMETALAKLEDASTCQVSLQFRDPPQLSTDERTMALVEIKRGLLNLGTDLSPAISFMKYHLGSQLHDVSPQVTLDEGMRAIRVDLVFGENQPATHLGTMVVRLARQATQQRRVSFEWDSASLQSLILDNLVKELQRRLADSVKSVVLSAEGPIQVPIVFDTPEDMSPAERTATFTFDYVADEVRLTHIDKPIAVGRFVSAEFKKHHFPIGEYLVCTPLVTEGKLKLQVDLNKEGCQKCELGPETIQLLTLDFCEDQTDTERVSARVVANSKGLQTVLAAILDQTLSSGVVTAFGRRELDKLLEGVEIDGSIVHLEKTSVAKAFKKTIEDSLNKSLESLNARCETEISMLGYDWATQRIEGQYKVQLVPRGE